MTSRLVYFTAALTLHSSLAWVPVNRPGETSTRLEIRRTTFRRFKSNVLDVEFDRVDHSAQSDYGSARRAAKSRDLQDDDFSKNLFDLSLEADSEFRDVRIPFLDYTTGGKTSNEGTSFIDCKLGFLADLDGVKYGVAVPFDDAVAITLEQPDGTVEYIAPIDENEELMRIMAAQLQEHVGPDLSLQRTPRVLTVAGPLGNYTDNWEENLTPQPIPASDLISDMSQGENGDDDLEFFHSFMKKELGKDVYKETLNEEPDLEEIEGMMDLFSVPGLGNNDSSESMEELLETLLDPELEFEKVKADLGFDKLNHDGVALKLVSYIFANGKSYSLVKLLKPYVLIGRYVQDPDDTRFELLTLEEEKLILPRLEELFKDDFEKAGLSISTQ